MTTELVTTPPQQSQLSAPSRASLANTFEPNTIEEALTLAKILVASRLLPDGVQTPEAAFTLIMMGRELGLAPMRAIRSIHVIKGKPYPSAKLLVALVMRSPVCEYWQMIETTDERAVYETKRRGAIKEVRLEYTIQQAQKAGLTGRDTWKGYAASMLRARASMALCDAVYPDITGGHIAVELADDLEATQTPVTLSAAEVAAKVAEPQELEPLTKDAIVAALAAASSTPEELSATAAELTRQRPTQKDEIRAAFKEVRASKKKVESVEAPAASD